MKKKVYCIKCNEYFKKTAYCVRICPKCRKTNVPLLFLKKKWKPKDE